MAIYELESRIYFDAAIAVDAIDVSQEMENSSSDADTSDNVEGSIQHDSIEEYSVDDLFINQLSNDNYIDAAIKNLDKIDFSVFVLGSQTEFEVTDTKTLLVSNELSEVVTFDDNATIIEYKADTSLELLSEQIADEVSELNNTDIDTVPIEVATTDSNFDITGLNSQTTENGPPATVSILSRVESEKQEFISELSDNYYLGQIADVTSTTDVFSLQSSVTSLKSDSNEIVFINSSVMDVEEIIDDLPENAEVVYLTSGEDGIKEITDYLADKTNIDTIRIISHGNEGYFVLNGEVIDSNYVTENADLIAGWGDALSDDGDIMIYGCSLAANTDGQNLIHNIADLTGADVAASTDNTGISDNWDLEFQYGKIESHELYINSYMHDLTNFTVTSSDGGVESGTLGEAIILANKKPGADEITFASSLDGIPITSDNQYTITDDLTITGRGVDNTIIQANAAARTAGYRVFTIESEDTVTISNMTIQNGNDSSGTGGGGILNEGTLTLSNTTVTNNYSTAFGGGIKNTGTLNITDSRFSSNSAPYGGGIYNPAAKTTTIVNSTIDSNSSIQGGGINNAGTMNITDSRFSSNTTTLLAPYASLGGGILNFDNLTITDCSFQNNSSAGDAGAIYIDNNATSYFYGTNTFSGNTSVSNGEAITVYGINANLYLNSSTLEIAEANAIAVTNGTFNTGTSTLIYNGADQTIDNLAYNNLTTMGSGTKTLSEAIDVNGNLTIGASTNIDVSVSNYQINIAGNWTNGGTFTPGTGTVVFDGGLLNGSPDPKITSGGSSFYNLTLFTNGNAELIDNMTITNTLTLTGGVLELGSSDLMINAGGSIVGTNSGTTVESFSSSNMIVVSASDGGILKRGIDNSGTYLFPVGTAGSYGYSPVTVTFASGTYTPGAYVSVSVDNLPEPSYPRETNYLNRYWTINSSSIADFSSSVMCYYNARDVAGTETFIEGARYSNNEWTIYNAVNTAVHSFTCSNLSLFGNFTGIGSNGGAAFNDGTQTDIIEPPIDDFENDEIDDFFEFDEDVIGTRRALYGHDYTQYARYIFLMKYGYNVDTGNEAEALLYDEILSSLIPFGFAGMSAEDHHIVQEMLERAGYDGVFNFNEYYGPIDPEIDPDLLALDLLFRDGFSSFSVLWSTDHLPVRLMERSIVSSGWRTAEVDDLIREYQALGIDITEEGLERRTYLLGEIKKSSAYQNIYNKIVDQQQRWDDFSEFQRSVSLEERMASRADEWIEPRHLNLDRVFMIDGLVSPTILEMNTDELAATIVSLYYSDYFNPSDPYRFNLFEYITNRIDAERGHYAELAEQNPHNDDPATGRPQMPENGDDIASVRSLNSNDDSDPDNGDVESQGLIDEALNDFQDQDDDSSERSIDDIMNDLQEPNQNLVDENGNPLSSLFDSYPDHDSNYDFDDTDFDYSEINSNLALFANKHPLFQTGFDIAIEEFMIV